jgi:hypothetical protein
MIDWARLGQVGWAGQNACITHVVPISSRAPHIGSWLGNDGDVIVRVAEDITSEQIDLTPVLLINHDPPAAGVVIQCRGPGAR